MSDTPRTDAVYFDAIKNCSADEASHVFRKQAEKLERELNQTSAQCVELTGECSEAIESRDSWKTLCLEQRQTIAELRDQLDSLNACLKSWKEDEGADAARLEWMLKASNDGLMLLDGWDRDSIDSAIENDARDEQLIELAREKMEAGQ